MPAKNKLIGKKYNHLEVIEYAGSSKNGKSLWKCLCDCGGYKVTLGQSIIEGRVTRCGRDECHVLRGEDAHSYRHGLIHTSEYKIWSGMLTRCTKETCDKYKDYGGRGIKCCNEWFDFINFYNDMGCKPTPKHELDRINNDDGYYKDNCRWATRKEQLRNTRRNTFVDYQGKKQRLVLLADSFNIKVSIVRSRLKRGWTIDEALNIPITAGKNIKYHRRDINGRRN